MKALVYVGPERMAYREVADPVPGATEVLVRVAASGICGSDMHAFLGHDSRRPAPLILGHEAAGVTEDGRRVTINPLVTCGVCPFCQAGRTNLCAERQIISMPPRPGAFAEMVAIPARNLITVPEGIGLAPAALTEPLACGWHAVRLGLRDLGDDPAVLVLGGGAIGVGAVLSLQAQGVRQISVVEPNEIRRARLAQILEAAVIAAPADGPFDLVIDAVGFAATRADASAHVRPGGVIVHIGLGENEGGLDVRRMTLQEITFIGTYTYTADDFAATAAAFFEGRMGPINWVEERALADGADAFADIRAGRVAAPKVVLVPEVSQA